jgi:hypothetical protein
MPTINDCCNQIHEILRNKGQLFGLDFCFLKYETEKPFPRRGIYFLYSDEETGHANPNGSESRRIIYIGKSNRANETETVYDRIIDHYGAWSTNICGHLAENLGYTKNEWYKEVSINDVLDRHLKILQSTRKFRFRIISLEKDEIEETEKALISIINQCTDCKADKIHGAKGKLLNRHLYRDRVKEKNGTLQFVHGSWEHLRNLINSTVLT